MTKYVRGRNVRAGWQVALIRHQDSPGDSRRRGVNRRHLSSPRQLDGVWRDVVIVERLVGEDAEFSIVSRLGNTKCLVDSQIPTLFDVVVRAADEGDCVPALAAVKAPRCARPLRADGLDSSSTPAGEADVGGDEVWRPVTMTSDTVEGCPRRTKPSGLASRVSTSATAPQSYRAACSCRTRTRYLQTSVA